MTKTKNFSDSTLYINFKSIQDNYLLLKSKAQAAETAAVVKANGYGLGVREVSAALWEAGARVFFVATLDEALELRTIFPPRVSFPRRRESITTSREISQKSQGLWNMDSRLRGNDKNIEILVFNGIRPGQESIFHKNKITPVLNTLAGTKLWTKYCRKIGEKIPAALHVDTGINRLGLSIKEAETNAAEINAQIQVKYLMSHLACADIPEHPKNTEQLKAFNRIRKFFPDALKSLANSAGILLADCYHFDLVRPGIALYGGNEMKPVISLHSKIIQLRKIDRREAVGYGATAYAAKGSVIATVPVGYADGYLRHLSNSGYCFIDGVKVPVIGRVSMDLITLNVSGIAEKNLMLGKEVELIGKHLSIDEIAGRAGTIGYEILTRLGARFNRVYLEK